MGSSRGTAGAADPALLLHFCAISIMYYSRPRCAISAAVCVLCYDDMGGELAVWDFGQHSYMARGGGTTGGRLDPFVTMWDEKLGLICFPTKPTPNLHLDLRLVREAPLVTWRL